MKRLVVFGLLLAITACAGTPRHGSETATGWATVRCEAQPNNAIKECVVVAESRSDAGFGEAAVRLVQQGRLTFEEADPESAFTATVKFREEDATAAPPD